MTFYIEPKARRKGKNNTTNSMMHRKWRERQRYTLEERTERKKARIMAKQQAREDTNEPSPFQGLVSFIDSLKKRRKGEDSAKDIVGGKKGQHQRQTK
jgi:hypothetical protein